MVETADKLTEAEAVAAAVPAARRRAALARPSASTAGLTLDSYLLRALSIAGWAPSFVDCARHRRSRAAHRLRRAARRRGLRRRARRPARPRLDPRDARPARRAARGRLGRTPRPRASAPAPRRAASSPPTPSSTSSAACARCRTSTEIDRTSVTPKPVRPTRDAVRLPAARLDRRCTRRDFPQGAVPNHVAIVMDGNGRWANRRGLTRIEGHKAGEAALLDVVAGAIQVGREAPVASTRSRPRTGRGRPRRCASSWASTATCCTAAATSSTSGACACGGRGAGRGCGRSVINELQYAERLTARQRRR